MSELLIMLAGILLVYCFLVGWYRAPDNSMYPSMRDGDLTIYYRLDKKYDPQDLVALERGEKKEIRRVVAVAGDQVDIRNGYVYINGIPQREPGIYEKTEQFQGGVQFPLSVPDGQIFVLADARENSTDSRIYGCVPVDKTFGTVIMIARRRGF